jgi:signal transduction histidine kinase
VLSNLIGTANKFTPAGGRIEVGVEEHETENRFYVKDTGPGIPPEHLSNVFDRFWQINVAGKGGTGLGLYIAKGIVNAHQGKIGVESKLGMGSTFWFTLPKKMAASGAA